MSEQIAHVAPARRLLGGFVPNTRTSTKVALILVLAVALQATAPEPARAATFRELRLLTLINETRAAHGLRALALGEDLSAVARQHSAAMAQQRQLFHTECLTCVVPVPTLDIMGENVGAGRGVRAVHRAMMRSAGHRANILRPGFDRIGLGVVPGGRRLWVTELFVG